MNKQRAWAVFFLFLFLLPSGAQNADPGKTTLSGFSFFLGGGAEGFLSAREPYDAKFQGQSRFSAGFRWAGGASGGGWTPFLLVRGDLVHRGTSDLAGGYLYNGLDGGSLSFGGGVLFPRIEGDPAFGGFTAFLLKGRFGLAGGFGGGLFGYTTGLNYFYYPALFVEPSWERPALLVRSWGALGLKVSLPLTWELRKDLDLSLGAGISLQGVYTFPGRKQ